MARTIFIASKGLERVKKMHARPLRIAMRRFEAVHSVHSVVLTTSFFSFSCGSSEKDFVLETGLHMAIKLQLRTLRRNVWCAENESGSRWKVNFS